jgi:hypothetical protein
MRGGRKVSIVMRSSLQKERTGRESVMADFTLSAPTKSLCVIECISPTCPTFYTWTSLAYYDLVYGLLTQEESISEIRYEITPSTKIVWQVLSWGIYSPNEQTMWNVIEQITSTKYGYPQVRSHVLLHPWLRCSKTLGALSKTPFRDMMNERLDFGRKETWCHIT